MHHYNEEVSGALWRIQGGICSLESLVCVWESKVPLNQQERVYRGTLYDILNLFFSSQFDSLREQVVTIGL